MMKLPKVMPEVSIIFKSEVPFEVTCEESFGYFIVPRENEKRSYAFYDYPEKTMTSRIDLKVARKAVISGIECVEIEGREYEPTDKLIGEYAEYIRLTHDAVQAVAEWHMEDGIKKFSTFLDENFLFHYGWGEDNYGFPIKFTSHPDLKLANGEIIYTKEEIVGLVGRYDVTINNKTYDTVRYVLIGDGLLAEKYIDQKGRTVLWRRYNRDDWKVDRYQIKWSERLPENIQIKVNGKAYIHWYDCITDYIC